MVMVNTASSEDLVVPALEDLEVQFQEDLRQVFGHEKLDSFSMPLNGLLWEFWLRSKERNDAKRDREEQALFEIRLMDSAAWKRMEKLTEDLIAKTDLVPVPELPNSSEWNPVFLNTRTGQLAGIDLLGKMRRTIVHQTCQLRTDDSGNTWRFPGLKPIQDQNSYNYTGHIHITVDSKEIPPSDVGVADTDGGWPPRIESISFYSYVSHEQVVEARFTTFVWEPI